MPNEKQIEAAARAMHDGPLGADDNEFDAPENSRQRAWCMEMARAALETAEGVKPRVKPLVWSDDPDAGRCEGIVEGDAFVVWSTSGFSYRIKERRQTDLTPYSCAVWYGGTIIGGYGSQKEAKAAAQADYEARILSALTTEGDE